MERSKEEHGTASSVTRHDSDVIVEDGVQDLVLHQIGRQGLSLAQHLLERR
jgi:hypothetical protein